MDLSPSFFLASTSCTLHTYLSSSLFSPLPSSRICSCFGERSRRTCPVRAVPKLILMAITRRERSFACVRTMILHSSLLLLSAINIKFKFLRSLSARARKSFLSERENDHKSFSKTKLSGFGRSRENACSYRRSRLTHLQKFKLNDKSGETVARRNRSTIGQKLLEE